ncbi:hypothetical protein HDV62DRAFT_375333 [Trichoderma sp. SZMC 28011]
MYFLTAYRDHLQMQYGVFRAISLLTALYTTSLISCALARNQVSIPRTSISSHLFSAKQSLTKTTPKPQINSS